MECVFCKTGRTISGETTLTLQRNEAIILVKNVPAQVCDNCGEAYLSAEANQIVLDLAEDAIRKGAELEIIRFPNQELTHA
jgi:YgiT-type zinc finger domain-containing protein